MIIEASVSRENTYNWLTGVLVVCIQPAVHEMTATNFSSVVAMLDYMNTALRTWKFATAQNGLMITYSLTTSGDAPVIVGDTGYWAVTATITAEG